MYIIYYNTLSFTIIHIHPRNMTYIFIYASSLYPQCIYIKCTGYTKDS